MKSLFLSIVFITTAAFSSLGQVIKTYGASDAKALQALPVKWERYWNHHDMDSIGTMLCNDVDFINVAGVWLKGKEATIADHKLKHQGVMFSKSIWKNESVEMKYVKPDVALLHIGWYLTDDYDADGTPRPPRRGIFTWVLTKEKGQWQLLAGHNVNIREPLIPAK